MKRRLYQLKPRSTKPWRRAMMFNAIFGGLGGSVMMIAAACIASKQGF